MLFKLLYLSTALNAADRYHFSDYEMAIRHKNHKTRISLRVFVSGLMSRFTQKKQDAIRSHIDSILP